MDGSFANQVLAQMYLYEKKFANINDEEVKKDLIKVEVLPKKLDEEVASYMVEGFGGVMTKLSDKQSLQLEWVVWRHLKLKNIYHINH